MKKGDRGDLVDVRVLRNLPPATQGGKGVAEAGPPLRACPVGGDVQTPIWRRVYAEKLPTYTRSEKRRNPAALFKARQHPSAISAGERLGSPRSAR